MQGYDVVVIPTLSKAKKEPSGSREPYAEKENTNTTGPRLLTTSHFELFTGHILRGRARGRRHS